MLPFLKWAGGKRQLLPRLRPFFPATFRTYHEPFLGSGAVFFDLVARGALAGRRAVLSDDNPDLIGTWHRVRDAAEEVLRELEILAAGHARGGAGHYADVRDGRFNPERAAWRGNGARLDGYSPRLAAMLLYLNRTGYNGLYRVNQSGDFNVPPGRYTRPRIADGPLLRTAAAALSAPGVEIVLAPFESVSRRARRGDFVYFDPPYAPLSPTANFRSYTPRGFDSADQARLQQVAVALARRGVHVVLSNSSAPLVVDLFANDAAAQAAGLRVHRVPARRAINTRADRRGVVEEVVVVSEGKKEKREKRKVESKPEAEGQLKDESGG